MKIKAPFLAALAFGAAAGCAPQPTPHSAAVANAGAAGADARLAHGLVQQKCSTCHSLDVALSGRRNAAQWGEVLEMMVGHGMVATDAELRTMQDYLAKRK